ncbi:MAG TPA: amidase [Anaerolineales bacterium]|nr:amidase [Anaerolineales bacterium]
MESLTIIDMQAKMQAGELTSRKLVEGYLERIQNLDKEGPRLNSIIELNPDALASADQLDQERASGQACGPLHGIPIVLKNNIDTADRMTTTAGSLALEGNIATQDAFLVSRLRAAGAVILAKANLSEWANFRSTHSVSGWSSLGGQTLNPYALDRNPCGSSSGSAVAVAASLCAAAVGTETDGSIVCPSHANSVVGIKPTLGLLSRAGVIPIAHSQDTAGPIARSVADAAIMLGAMTSIDTRDPATSSSQGKFYSDYTQFLKPDGLKGARIGVAREFFGFHPQVDKIMETCLAALKSGGAELVDPADIATKDKTDDTELEVLFYEFKGDLNTYLGALRPEARVHSLEEVIAFNEANQERVMPFFGQERMLKAQEKGPLTDEAYLKALETNHRLARAEGIDLTLQKHKLDAIVAPTGGPAWLIDYVNGDHYGGGSSSPAAVAGYPNITVPAGYVYGLPVGISFIGTAYAEPTLLRLAYAFEQITRVRQPPQFLPSVDLVSGA